MNIIEGYVLILTVVNKGWSNVVLDAATAAGAKGATVFYGRGTGASHMPKLFGITIEPEKEIIINAVPREIAHKVLEAVSDTVTLSAPGKGISMLIPLDGIVGIVEAFTPSS